MIEYDFLRVSRVTVSCVEGDSAACFAGDFLRVLLMTFSCVSRVTLPRWLRVTYTLLSRVSRK